jgi:hypothetical protein
MAYYSPAMGPDIHQILLDSLRQQGINTEDAPALLRDLSTGAAVPIQNTTKIPKAVQILI